MRPLHTTSYAGHRDCAELLLGHKADLNHQIKVVLTKLGASWEVAPVLVGADACIVGV